MPPTTAWWKWIQRNPPRRTGRTSSRSGTICWKASAPAAAYIFASYLKDATTRIHRFKLDGTDEQEIQLPDLGSAGGFGGKRDATFSFYSFTSFTDPGTIYKYDYATGKSEVFSRPELKFEPSQFVTEQVFYPSKDGTKVPMFIVHKKGVEKNGKNPTLLYAYGGFNVSLSPSFSTSRMILLGTRWRVRLGQPARWRRVWRGMAQGRHEGEEAERVRRLHRGC
jgi:prolyl oligopeptidase